MKKITNNTNPGFEPVEGDVVTDGRVTWPYTPPYVPDVPEPYPKVLPILDFLRYAAAQLGGGGRVTEIIEGFRDHATADLRYGFQEFDKATSFDKVKVDELLGAGVTGGILTAEEHQLINENWPES